MSLLSLTPEVLQVILQDMDPVDVSRCAMTCRALAAFANQDNVLLWKSLFLSMFDPLEASSRPGYVWRSETGETAANADYARLVKERCRARGIIRSPHQEKKAEQRGAVLKTLLDIYLSADSRHVNGSKNAAFLAEILSSKAIIAEWLLPPIRTVMPYPAQSRRARRNSDVHTDEESMVDDDDDDDEADADFVPAVHAETSSSSGASDEDMGDHLEHISIGDDASSSQLPEETPAEDVHVPPPVADMLLSLATTDSDDGSQMGETDDVRTNETTPDTSSPKVTRPSPAQHPDITAISCQLHAAGMSLREVVWSSYRSGQPYREMVYKGDHFNALNLWGPYKKRRDGRVLVDWQVVHAVTQTMALNVKSAWHQWAEPEEMNTLPYGFEKAVLWKQPGPGRDWACVEGRWSYVYAFIDYTDFFAFNFAASSLQTAPNSDLDGISEAVGGVNTLTLRLSDHKHEGLYDSDEDKGFYTDEDEQEEDPYPDLYFEGQATGPNGTTFRGKVSLLEDGNRRWTFIIRYSGDDRWQTECVEVGNRGLYGIWSDVLHEDLSP